MEVLETQVNKLHALPFKLAGLIIQCQHIFHRYIGNDAVVRTANVAAVFAQHPDALTHFPADILGGPE
jgi:hypothetical protein